MKAMLSHARSRGTYVMLFRTAQTLFVGPCCGGFRIPAAGRARFIRRRVPAPAPTGSGNFWRSHFFLSCHGLPRETFKIPDPLHRPIVSILVRTTQQAVLSRVDMRLRSDSRSDPTLLEGPSDLL